MACEGRNFIDSTSDLDNWVYDNKRIRYCLSSKQPEHCKLQLSLPLIVIVIVFNLCKAIVMLVVAFDTKEEPLITLGDAIASFVERTDDLTKTLNMAPKFTFEKWGTG